MPRRRAALLSALFFVEVALVELLVGPALVTRGWERGEDLPAQPMWTAVGVLLVAVGVVVLVRCYVLFVREGRGTPAPAARTSALVASGPYAVVRNPQHLAAAAVIVGQGLLLARPVLLVAAAAYLTTFVVLTRWLEEPRLSERLGPAYDEYRERVPAWLPRVRDLAR